MATPSTILQDWAEGDAKRSELFVQFPALVLRWFNEAQLRYCDKSEMIQSTWSPTITSSGNIALPTDFLREIPNRVKWSSDVYLTKIDYPTANLITTFSGTYFYSIWNGTFYVWSAAAGTPSIPYIAKPAVVLIANIASDSLEIPTEFHHNLLLFLDAMLERRMGNYEKSKAILAIFDAQAYEDGRVFRGRRNPAPMMLSSRF